MSDSVRPHRRQPARILSLWDSPGKNTGVGCHFLLPSVSQRMNFRVWIKLSMTSSSHQMNCKFMRNFLSIWSWKHNSDLFKLVCLKLLSVWSDLCQKCGRMPHMPECAYFEDIVCGGGVFNIKFWRGDSPNYIMLKVNPCNKRNTHCLHFAFVLEI